MVSPSNKADKTPSIDQLKAFENKRKKCDRDNVIKKIVAGVFALLAGLIFCGTLVSLFATVTIIPVSNFVGVILVVIAFCLTYELLLTWEKYKEKPKFSNPEVVNTILDDLKRPDLTQLSAKNMRSYKYSIKDLYKCGIITFKAKKEIDSLIKKRNLNTRKMQWYEAYKSAIEKANKTDVDKKNYEYYISKLDEIDKSNKKLQDAWELLSKNEISPNLPASLEIPIKA